MSTFEKKYICSPPQEKLILSLWSEELSANLKLANLSNPNRKHQGKYSFSVDKNMDCNEKYEACHTNTTVTERTTLIGKRIKFTLDKLN